jgi:hypothetical protein
LLLLLAATLFSFFFVSVSFASVFRCVYLRTCCAAWTFFFFSYRSPPCAITGAAGTCASGRPFFVCLFRVFLVPMFKKKVFCLNKSARKTSIQKKKEDLSAHEAKIERLEEHKRFRFIRFMRLASGIIHRRHCMHPPRRSVAA